jgi:hypothetical protein
VKVIRHHDKIMDGCAWKMIRNLHPTRSNDLAQRAQYDSAMLNPAKDGSPVHRTNRDEVRSGLGVVSPSNPDRPAMQILLSLHC